MKKATCVYILVVVLVVSAILLPGLLYQDPLAILFDPEQALTFEGALAIAVELDRIADRLEMPPVPDSAGDLTALALEVVPYYYYEKVAEEVRLLPPISWQWFLGDENFHIMGRCWVGAQPKVALNLRFANPWSSIYGRESLIAVLVHELAHANGVYAYGCRWSEPATQAVTLEVLAAMSNNSNPWGLPSFVRELQSFADDYALSLAIKDGRLAEYREYLQRVDPGPRSAARFQRMLMHWRTDWGTLKEILELYGEWPYRLTVEALSTPQYLTRELPPLPNSTDRLEMNDTAYLIRHLREMAGAYPDLLAERPDLLED